MVIGATFMGMNSMGLWIMVFIGNVEKKTGIPTF
jgi:hypothetical protein